MKNKALFGIVCFLLHGFVSSDQLGSFIIRKHCVLLDRDLGLGRDLCWPVVADNGKRRLASCVWEEGKKNNNRKGKKSSLS